MLDEVTEPVSPAAEVELALASAMLEDMLEAMLEPEDMADEAEEAALSEAEDMEDDISIMELLLLSGAAVELAEPSQVAAVGRFVTPCPEQREFANSRVSEEALVWCDLSSFLCYSSCLIFFSLVVELTFLVILVTGRADTAREAGEQGGGAADALHIERAAVAEAGADTGGGARGKTGDLGGGEAR